MNETFLKKFIIFFITTIPLISGTGLILQNPDHAKFVFGLFGISVILLIWSTRFANSKDFCIKKNELYTPISFFLLWCFVSLFWAFSTYFALMQIAQFLSYGAIFFIINNILKNDKERFTLLNYILVSLFTVSLIGIIQFYFDHNDFISSLFFQAVGPASTFGNKNMASHFLVMTIPLAIVLFMSASNKLRVGLYSLVIFFSLLYLIQTTARQAYLAIAIEFILLILFIIYDYQKNIDRSLIKALKLKKIKFFSFIFIGIFLFLSINLPSDNSASKSIYIDQVKSIYQDKNNARFAPWKNTLEMIKDRPLFGFGVNQWSQHYGTYYRSSVFDRGHNHKNKFVNAHNDYLEMVANLGFIGLALLFWILFLASKKIYSILSEPVNPYRSVVLGLSLGLVGFLIVAFFSFPLSLYIPGFFVMMYLGLIYSFDQKAKIKHSVLSKKFIVTIAIFFSILLFLFSFKSLSGQYFFHQSISNYNKGETEQAVKDMNTALSFDKNPNFYQKISEYLLHQNKPKLAIFYLEKAKDIFVFHTPSLFNLAEAYRATNNLDKQKMTLENILVLDDKNIKASALLVRNLYIQQKYKQATIEYKRTKQNFKYFKGKLGYGYYHAELAEIALLVSDYKYFGHIYDDLLMRDPSAENYTVYGIVEYQRLGNKNKAKRLFLKALELDKKHKIPEEIRKDLGL